MSYKLKGIVQNFEIFSSFLRIMSCVNKSRKTERTTSKVFKKHYSTVHKNVKKQNLWFSLVEKILSKFT